MMSSQAARTYTQANLGQTSAPSIQGGGKALFPRLTNCNFIIYALKGCNCISEGLDIFNILLCKGDVIIIPHTVIVESENIGTGLHAQHSICLSSHIPP